MSRSGPVATAALGRTARRPISPEAVVLALTVLAAAFRLYQLGGRSLWVDETLAGRSDHLGSIGQVLAATPLDHLPLDLVISWLLRFLGEGEAVLRLPAAAFGILLVPALFLLGRRLLGTTAGLVAALLAAVSPFAIWYSQEVAPYSMLMLLVTLEAWAAHRAAEKARLGDWLLVALLTALSLYTHYTAALVAVAIFGWLAVELGLQARERRLGWEPVITRYLGLALATMLTLLAIAPWTPAIRAFIASAAGPQAAKYAAAGNPLLNLASLLDGLGIGWLMAALVLVGVWAATRRRSLLLLSWAAVPLLGWLAALQGGILVVLPRYLAELWPALVLLAAAGATALAQRPSRQLRISPGFMAGALAALLVLEAAPTVLRWYGEPKDDWRGAAALIAAHSGSTSPVLSMGNGSDFAAYTVSWYLDHKGAHRQVFDAGGSSSDSRSTTDRMAAAMRALDGHAFAVVANSRGPLDLRAGGRSQTGVYTTVPGAPADFTRTDLIGVTVVEAPALTDLLRWGGRFVPGVLATDALTEQVDLAGSLLPPSTDPGPFTVTSRGEFAQRTWTAPAVAGLAMVARFTCATAGGGDARVYVSAHDAAGAFIGLYPDNGGYRCQDGPGAFAFSTPPGTARVELWLRVTGRGSGDYSQVQLGVVPPE